jgi:hypothetical protein
MIRPFAGECALTGSITALGRQVVKLPVQYGWGILRYGFHHSQSWQRAVRSRLNQREDGRSAEDGVRR